MLKQVGALDENDDPKGATQVHNVIYTQGTAVCQPRMEQSEFLKFRGWHGLKAS